MYKSEESTYSSNFFEFWLFFPLLFYLNCQVILNQFIKLRNVTQIAVTF